MPKVSGKKEPIDVYKFHGVEFNNEAHNAEGECPFCGREKKFVVNTETGQFRCVVCDVSGNCISFVDKIWRESLEQTQQSDYSLLAEDRGEFIHGFKKFGLARSFVTGHWLIPAWNAESKINQVYQRKGKLNLPTPTLGQGLLGIGNFDPTINDIHLLEGVFDGAAWASAKLKANTLAIPGCNVFFDTWLNYFRGKNVTLIFDSDHKRKHPKKKGTYLDGAGFGALKKVAPKIHQVAEEVKVVLWGEEGYEPDWDSGTDVRDIFNGEVEL